MERGRSRGTGYVLVKYRVVSGKRGKRRFVCRAFEKILAQATATSGHPRNRMFPGFLLTVMNCILTLRKLWCNELIVESFEVGLFQTRANIRAHIHIH